MQTGTQAIDRAAQLLVEVIESEQAPGVGELAESSGLPKSTASRLLRALERHGLVQRDGARGYATAVDELEEGLTAVAAPVFDSGGRVIAALSISGPTIRLTRARIEELVPGLVQEAHALSGRLGHQDDQRGAA